MSLRIGCIVEGHGEIESVPILIRRIAHEIAPDLVVQLNRTVRVPKNKLILKSELERTVEIVARGVGPRGGILVLLDSDDECPAALGRDLLIRARQTRPHLPIRIVLAKREFEAWFLAAAESLRGRRGLANDLVSPVDPEAIRGAKEWLTARMSEGRHYVETLDQPALAASFDLRLARKAASFDKFFRDVSAVLADLASEPPSPS
jgi:Domain of unknown function (DUF4276)